MICGVCCGARREVPSVSVWTCVDLMKGGSRRKVHNWNSDYDGRLDVYLPSVIFGAWGLDVPSCTTCRVNSSGSLRWSCRAEVVIVQRLVGCERRRAYRQVCSQGEIRHYSSVRCFTEIKTPWILRKWGGPPDERCLDHLCDVVLHFIMCSSRSLEYIIVCRCCLFARRIWALFG